MTVQGCRTMRRRATITIREAAAGADAAAASAVVEAAFAPLASVYRPVGEAAARQAERAKEGTRLVAEVGGRVVGTVQYAVHRDHVHVIGLAVHPDAQRMGVARALIVWIASLAPGLRRDIVRLDTIRETGNVAVFERLGFRTIKEAIPTWCASDDHSEVHEVTMERHEV
jgi:ribosomal protein S18 acetylase RimI-like enzyme